MLERLFLSLICVALLAFAFVLPFIGSEELEPVSAIYSFARSGVWLLAFSATTMILFSIWSQRNKARHIEVRFILTEWRASQKKREQERRIKAKHITIVLASGLLLSSLGMLFLAMITHFLTLVFLLFEMRWRGIALIRQVGKERVRRLYPDFFYSKIGQDNELRRGRFSNFSKRRFLYKMNKNTPKDIQEIYKTANTFSYLSFVTGLVILIYSFNIFSIVIYAMCLPLTHAGLWTDCPSYFCSKQGKGRWCPSPNTSFKKARQHYLNKQQRRLQK